MNFERDFARLTEALLEKGAVEIPIPCRGGIEEAVAHGLVSRALASAGKDHLESTLHLVLDELLKNAEQAVLKRAYFKKGNISEPTAKDCQLFRASLDSALKASRAELRSSPPPRMRVNLSLEKDHIALSVMNRGIPDPLESQHIRERLEMAQGRAKFTGLGQVPPTPQGLGQGLLLVTLALKQAGISTELMSWAAADNRTNFRVEIPTRLPTPDQLAKIEREIIDEVKGLPSFPEVLHQIRDLCHSEDSSMKQVADAILRDQAMAGQIIKLANSGGYAGGQVADINEAVKVIGLRSIANLLLQVGAFNILSERYGRSEDLVEHPVQVGFFSRSLARLHKRAVLADEAYVAGLLHDIGKVVLLSAMKASSDYQILSKDRDRRSQVHLEEMACGASHALVGALLAHKWKFPELLSAAIRYHHTPRLAPPEHREVVYIVYMANAMADSLARRLDFFAVEPDVLAYFNFTTEDAFKMMAATMNSEFKEYQKRGRS